MTQTFTIPGRLPGYNELHMHPWQVARRVKKEAMDAVIWAAREARLQPVKGRCVVRICCYEPNRRRDVDNVKAGANKVILDALQQVGILAGDGQKYVADVQTTVEVVREDPRVEVIIREVQDENQTG